MTPPFAVSVPARPEQKTVRVEGLLTLMAVLDYLAETYPGELLRVAAWERSDA